ncbi:MAG: molybdopterin oxidoreductase family protein [Gammaproteobacteria bacterium]|nr:molybdopterin oxidoreductase family protein [Gammaproteobacteria bacterium]
MTADRDQPWHKTACIICALNCGLEVQTEGRRITKIRGDDDHPVSKGYVCEKSQRLDYYQNGADRLTSPMRRRPDGSYEAIDWDTAIREIAQKLKALKERHGGESILYYGGANQGSHLGGTYADSTQKALGIKYRSNALAQEKTGEFWVGGKMLGTGAHGDFEHCEVAVFVGKNPWHSHGFARTRVVLREIEKDPNRSLVVIDPRVSETAAMADFHLQTRPGTDAWCLAALAAILVQEDLVAKDWIAGHTTGYEQIAPALRTIDVPRYAATCGVDEELLRRAARRIAAAKSVAMMEDLGIQMNVHSTLNSYLQRLVWLLTGNYGREGTNNAFVPFLSLAKLSKGEGASKSAARPAKPVERRSPVVGAKIIIGLIPCNVIPEEILTDHPKRYRAMWIECSNPVHSLADSQRMREAIRALELSVVVDVAMTETARVADYVLPASSQFEKADATFFNLEFPRNGFHLRHPLFAPLPGTLPEAEIHARLIEALGELGERDYAPLRRAARLGRLPFALAFAWASARNPRVARYASVVLYRTLGPALPPGLEPAASLWGVAQMYVRSNPKAAALAGFSGSPILAGNRLFDAILANTSGLIFAVSDYADSWEAVRLPDHRINLYLAELMPELERIDREPLPRDAEYPFILSAGERRGETMNTLVRDASWHRKGAYGALRLSPADAGLLGCRTGDTLKLSTRRGSAAVVAEVTDIMRPGHISLPNGQGLDYRSADGRVVRAGAAPNELTDVAARDFLAGTPWHKHVPARLELQGEGP